MNNTKELITDALKEKACLKQEIFSNTKKVFLEFQNNMKLIIQDQKSIIEHVDKRVELSYQANGDYEAQMKLGGDMLIFNMHTNIFNFDENHEIHQKAYVKKNPLNAYCGMINIYNFLSDSFTFNRLNDIGYLIARIFINHENHFFVEGKRQLGFLYNDFENVTINPVYVKAIIESAILYAIEFDLLVPPYDHVKEIPLGLKLQQAGNAYYKTGKRLGFHFKSDHIDIR